MISVIQRLWERLKASFSHSKHDSDFEDELAHHLEMLTEDNIRSGLTREEATRKAKQQLGGLEQTRELHRRSRGLPFLEQLGRDIKYSFRLMKKDRTFATIAVALVAIGIGMNTTVFSLINTTILQPLPFPDSERMVWISNGNPERPSTQLSRISHRVDTMEGLQQINQSLDTIEAYDPFSLRQTYRLTSQGEPQTINSVIVSHGLFRMLGIKPLHGRLFNEEDSHNKGTLTSIISHELWRRSFNSDPSILGKSAIINKRPIQIVGVLPPANKFTSTFYPATRVDAFTVLINDHRRNWGNTLSLIGLSKPGITTEQVAADLNRSIDQLKEQYPDRQKSYFANTISFQERITGHLKKPLTFLWLAAGLVLLIVAFNLGSLLLARGIARKQEISLRASLGAKPGRLFQQLITETLILVSIGSILGLTLAFGLVQYLSKLPAIEIPLLQTLHLDSTSILFTIALCLVTAIVCGIAPAWSLISGNINTNLKPEARSTTANRRLMFARSSLVSIEIALACVLAITAAQLYTSFQSLMNKDLGYQPENLIAARIDPVVDWEHSTTYLETVLDRVRPIPGVTHAGLTDCIPVERDRSWGLAALGDPNEGNVQDRGTAHIRVVSPGLITAMGTKIVEGREFDRLLDGGENSEPTIVINESLAKQFWPDESALGKYVRVNGTRRVIGVVEDVYHGGPEIEPGNEMYLAMHQQGSRSWDLMIRTRLPLHTIKSELAKAIHEIDPSLPLNLVRPVSKLVDQASSSRKLLVTLVSGFATVAVGLSILGLYGVISYMVSQRTAEIGIKIALGGTRSRIHKEILLYTGKLALIGLAFGVALSIASNRFLQFLLLEETPSALLIYVLSTAAIALCSLVAGYLPARRASNVNPMVALRT